MFLIPQIWSIPLLRTVVESRKSRCKRELIGDLKSKASMAPEMSEGSSKEVSDRLSELAQGRKDLISKLDLYDPIGSSLTCQRLREH